MLQGEHSAILSTFIKLPFAINNFVLCIFESCLRQVSLYIIHTFQDGSKSAKDYRLQSQCLTTV